MLLASLWAKNTQRGQQTFELQWSESTSVSDPIVHHDSYDHYSKGRQFLTSFICSFREMIAVSASFPPDLTRWHQLPSTLLQKSFYGFLENSVKLRGKRRFSASKILRLGCELAVFHRYPPFLGADHLYADIGCKLRKITTSDQAWCVNWVICPPFVKQHSNSHCLDTL